MMVRIDTDHAAPRALTHERPQTVELETMAENVAVGTGERIGHRDDRPADGVGRIWKRRSVSWRIVSYPLAHELFEQQRRDVAAAVVTNVDDQSFSIELAQVASVELRETPRPHVGNVQVADALAGALVHV